MLTGSQTVRIERHDLPGGLVALTYADPERLAGGEDTVLPLAFVLHGLGSRKERHLDVCLRVARAGMLACAVDARHHGERWTPESGALYGDRSTLAFLQTFADAVQGTAEDVSRLTDYFGRDHCGIIGHSMGGFTAVHAALADRRAVAVANVSGSIDARPPVGAVLPPEIAALASAADPAARAADLWPCALLLLHGDVDETVPLAGARRLYDAAAPAYTADPSRLELNVLPGVGHEWTTDMAERAVDWLARHLTAAEDTHDA